MSTTRPAAVRTLVLGLGWFPDQHGGLDRYVRELIGGLGADAEAVVIGPASDAPEGVHAVATHDAPLGVRLAVVRPSGGPGGRSRRRHRRALRVVRGLAARPRSARRRVPLVVHFHGPWATESMGDGEPRGLAYRVRRAIERFVCRRAEVIVVLSEAFASVVVEHTGVTPGIASS